METKLIDDCMKLGFGMMQLPRVEGTKAEGRGTGEINIKYETIMEASARLYTLNYDEAKTYMWAAIFVACNLVLPQVFHLIPQRGIIFAPLSLVILAGAYKFGWRVGLIAALASPLVNHLLTGMPTWNVLPVMTFKLAVLALIAGFTAQHFRKVTLPLLIGVVLVAELTGGLGELALTGGIEATVQDFAIGWPGLLPQIIGAYLVCKYL